MEIKDFLISESDLKEFVGYELSRRLWLANNPYLKMYNNWTIRAEGQEMYFKFNYYRFHEL